jgi:hypothetical protein
LRFRRELRAKQPAFLHRSQYRGWRRRDQQQRSLSTDRHGGATVGSGSQQRAIFHPRRLLDSTDTHFLCPDQTGNNFLVSIQSEPGKTYTVQYQSALGSGWQNLSNILGDGSIITVSNAAAGASQKFYRLIEQ